MNLEFIKKTVFEEMKLLLEDSDWKKLKEGGLEEQFKTVAFTANFKSFFMATDPRQDAARKVLSFFTGSPPVEQSSQDQDGSESGIIRSLFKVAVWMYADTLSSEEKQSFLEKAQMG